MYGSREAGLIFFSPLTLGEWSNGVLVFFFFSQFLFNMSTDLETNFAGIRSLEISMRIWVSFGGELFFLFVLFLISRRFIFVRTGGKDKERMPQGIVDTTFA